MSETIRPEDISSPDDIKAIPAKDIPAFDAALRRFLIEKVTKCGGHLASNLGALELSVALHRVFSTPEDHIIFDVGHQSYVHKILTGRAGAFDSLRTPGGLSGFPSRRESEHDAFGTGHSSTALSAALGLAEADALAGRKNYTVAVVGDGAMTGGLFHEALNNCRKGLRLIVVLNDNDMSISPNIGLFARYLTRIRLSRGYTGTKRRTKAFLSRIPLLGRPLAAALSGTKAFFKRHLYGRNYFEELGFIYLGPIDGNDEAKVERGLREAKRCGDTVILHLTTKKGKGYPPAEKNPVAYHGLSLCRNKSAFHTVAGEELCALAETDSAICAVTAAMKEGTGLSAFAQAYPERFFDVGIAEAHGATFSAGLSAGGMKPYFAVYSTFLQRAYDSVLHDVALQGLPVRFLVDRAGLATADGATHHGIFDVSFLSSIPGMTIWAPSCYGVLRAMLHKSAQVSFPLAIRYENAAESEEIKEAFYPDGQYENFGVHGYRTAGARAVILSYGAAVYRALQAAKALEKENIPCGVILLEELKPYNRAAARVLSLLPAEGPVVFLEEGIENGGAGMLLGAALEKGNTSFRRCHSYRVLAIDDHFASPSAPADLVAYCGIAAEDAVNAVRQMTKKKLKRVGPVGPTRKI